MEKTSTKGWKIFFLSVPPKEKKSEEIILKSDEHNLYDAITTTFDNLEIKEFKIVDVDNPDWEKENEGASIVIDKVVNLENNITSDGANLGMSLLVSQAVDYETNKGKRFYRFELITIGKKLGRVIKGTRIYWMDPSTPESKERLKKFIKQIKRDKNYFK